MARGLHRLSARTVTSVREPGKLSDGGGLYLHVRKRGDEIERLFVFKFKRGGRAATREQYISLGPARDVTLHVAREKARICREALAKGDDPRAAVRANDSETPTFGEAADEFVKTVSMALRNSKHKAQWESTLGDKYCKALRKKMVSQVSTADVLETLKPIWEATPETASRLRGRIERVLDSAKVNGHRSGENPARWKGHLALLLPKPASLSRGHHKALPWEEMPAFMVELRKLDSVSALALEWTILTASRTNETLGTPLSGEINTDNRVWIVPASRMKEHREHRVPLSERCLGIVKEVQAMGVSKWAFPSTDPKRHLSTGAMSECLKGLVGNVATVHGFRSSFRDWITDATEFPEWLAEAALSHKSGDKVEAAYKRSDALERRRSMMEAWERYCLSNAARVTSLAEERAKRNR